MKQYDDNQYYEQGDAELGTGFTNYERLLLELNYKNYYPNKTTAEMTGNKDYEGLKGDRIRVYEKILNECGLDPEANYDKNTDHGSGRIGKRHLVYLMNIIYDKYKIERKLNGI